MSSAPPAGVSASRRSRRGGTGGRLAVQSREFRPLLAVIADVTAAGELARELSGSGIEVAAGPEGLLRAAALPEAEIVLSAIVGAAGSCRRSKPPGPAR